MPKQIKEYTILTPERMTVWYGSEEFIISNEDGKSLMFEDLKALAEKREAERNAKIENAKKDK